MEAVLDFATCRGGSKLLRGQIGLDALRDRFAFVNSYSNDLAGGGRHYVQFTEDPNGGADGLQNRLPHDDRNDRAVDPRGRPAAH